MVSETATVTMSICCEGRRDERSQELQTKEGEPQACSGRTEMRKGNTSRLLSFIRWRPLEDRTIMLIPSMEREFAEFAYSSFTLGELSSKPKKRVFEICFQTMRPFSEHRFLSGSLTVWSWQIQCEDDK